jgi:hypothetical protein
MRGCFQTPHSQRRNTRRLEIAPGSDEDTTNEQSMERRLLHQAERTWDDSVPSAPGAFSYSIRNAADSLQVAAVSESIALDEFNVPIVAVDHDAASVAVSDALA